MQAARAGQRACADGPGRGVNRAIAQYAALCAVRDPDLCDVQQSEIRPPTFSKPLPPFFDEFGKVGFLFEWGWVPLWCYFLK